jgi:hypothetical protein
MRAPLAFSAVFLPVAITSSVGCRGEAAECRPRAEELGRFLTTMDHDMTPFTPAEDVHLVTRTDLAPVDLRIGPVVDVAGSRVRLDGEAVADRADLASRLARAYDTAGQPPPPGGFPAPELYVALDADARWDTVVWIAEEASRAGVAAPRFAFARPPATPPPARTATDDAFDAIMKRDAADRATEAARITSDIVSRCDALKDEFSRISTVPGEDKAATLLAAVGPALVECDCKADLPALRTAFWRVVGNPRPMSFLPVRLDQAAAPLSLPPTTPWREASQRLPPGGPPIWLTR